jgi:parallel beta-helix repeat protein
MNREGITLWSSPSNTILNNAMISCSLFIDGFQQQFWNTHTIDASNTVNGRPVYYYIDKNEGAVPSDAGQVILANCVNVQVENLVLNNIFVPISLGFSFSNKIANNTLSNNSAGIYFYSSNLNNVTNNTCNLNDRFGINLEQSDQNKITKNNCSNNGENSVGIYLFSSDGNMLFDNKCNFNRFDGINLYESENNIIIHNIVSSNLRNGIFLNHFANNNIITNNEILFNNNYGIHITHSNYTDIYYNSFISNVNQALVTGNSFNNQWDNDNDEGNYWDDYTGLDNGYNKRILGDGIGDTKIPHQDLDNYPFINPMGWYFPGLPALIDPGDFVPDGNYTVSWLANRGTLRYLLEEDDNYEFDSPTVVYDGLELAIHFWYKPNGTYFYRLKTFSEHYESDWSNIVDITVDWPPAIPQNLMASVYPVGNSLNISWDLNSIDTKEYDIYNKTNNGWNILATIVHPEHTFNHTGLQDGKKYYYKIKSRDFRGQESNFTEIESAIPADSIPPVAPSGLEVIEITFDSIKLRWEQNIEDDIMGYNIYRSLSSNPSDWGEPIVTTLLGNITHIDSGLIELTQYYYVITAFDEVPFESNFSKQVSGTTILGEHGPEINNSIGNFSIDEDCTDFLKIKLLHWFKDQNHDPLTFWCEGQSKINVTIFQKNGSVRLCPKPNWHGEEILTFFASDGKNECSESVTITVSPVNDPPGQAKIISPKNGVIFDYGDDLDFRAECSDPDLPDDNLNFTWSSDIYGLIGYGEILKKGLPAGEHDITLEVRDNKGKTSTASINISVKKAVEGTSSLLVPATSGVIIVIIFIIILFMILKRRKEVEKKETVAAQPQTQTYTVPTQQMQVPPIQPYAEMLARTQVPGQLEAPIGPMTSTMKPTTGQPTPQPQAQPSVPSVTTPQPSVTKKIEWGGAYIIITKAQDFGLNIFEGALGSSPERGLCITRTHPSILKKSPIMTGITKIWLSNTPGEDSVSPGNVTKLAHVINQFITTHSKAVILIDGLGFLINNNDFQRILKFLEMIHEMIVLNNGALLVPINPLTLSKIDFELLENELINTIKDPAYQPK